MKRFSPFLLAAAAALSAGTAHAGDRYGERPPIVLSPDLTAPWLMQLQIRPVVAPDGTVTLQRMPARTQAGAPPVATEGAAQRQAPRSLDYYPPAPTARLREQAPVRQAMLVRPAQKTLTAEPDPQFLPQEVAYDGPEKPGTIVIDTRNKFLFYVQPGGRAERYGVGVGKEGFEWSGKNEISRKAEWPEWRPPQEMIAREKARGRILPTMMTGGPDNPLGARALYIGSTLYRIHGTNQPWTIGKAVSSGCIRMRNEDVIQLYNRVKVGTGVVVM